MALLFFCAPGMADQKDTILKVESSKGWIFDRFREFQWTAM